MEIGYQLLYVYMLARFGSTGGALQAMDLGNRLIWETIHRTFTLELEL